MKGKRVTHGIGGMEHIGGRRIVENDHLIDRSAKLGEVLYVVASVIDAGLPK